MWLEILTSINQTKIVQSLMIVYVFSGFEASDSNPAKEVPVQIKGL